MSDHDFTYRTLGVPVATSAANQLDRRKHRGPWRFLYMDLKAFLRRYFRVG